MHKFIAMLSLLTLWISPTFAQQHTKPIVFDVAWSRDGQQLAIATADSVLLYEESAEGMERLWAAEAMENEERRVVTFSPDRLWVAAGGICPDRSCPGKVYVWNSATGEEIAEFVGNTSAVYSLMFSPDGSQLAVGGGEWWIPVDAYIRFWNTQAWMEQQQYRINGSGIVDTVRYSPDGRWFAYSSRYGSTYLVDVHAWAAAAAVHISSNLIQFDRASSRIWLRSEGIEAWEIRELPEVHLVRVNNQNNPPQSNSVTEESLIGFGTRFYATTSNDGLVRVRSMIGAERYQEFIHVENDRRFTHAIFNSDETRVALINEALSSEIDYYLGRDVSLWTLDSGEYINLEMK